MSMNPPSVLIVGAGALGVVTGYHLGLSGAAVTFLVRPARLDALQSPQLLYCYDDDRLREYTGYRVITAAAEAAAQSFDYVLVTLDGAACRSDEGTKLLADLGAVIRPTVAQMMICGVGIGLREHFLQATGLPQERLLHGTMRLFSYQVARANMPVHAGTDAAKLARASIAYHHFPVRQGFGVAVPASATARKFAALYNRSGASHCSVMNMTLYSIVTNFFFPLFAACEIAGWPNAETMASNKALWSLCCKAQNEIVGLRQHGWIGKLMRLLMTEGMYLKLLRKLERESEPLDFHAFSRFHHGGKVQQQDIQVMQNCVKAGESNGQPMTALKEILRQLDAHKRQQVV